MNLQWNCTSTQTSSFQQGFFTGCIWTFELCSTWPRYKGVACVTVIVKFCELLVLLLTILEGMIINLQLLFIKFNSRSSVIIITSPVVHCNTKFFDWIANNFTGTKVAHVNKIHMQLFLGTHTYCLLVPFYSIDRNKYRSDKVICLYNWNYIVCHMQLYLVDFMSWQDVNTFYLSKRGERSTEMYSTLQLQ